MLRALTNSAFTLKNLLRHYYGPPKVNHKWSPGTLMTVLLQKMVDDSNVSDIVAAARRLPDLIT